MTLSDMLPKVVVSILALGALVLRVAAYVRHRREGVTNERSTKWEAAGLLAVFLSVSGAMLAAVVYVQLWPRWAYAVPLAMFASGLVLAVVSGYKRPGQFK